MINPMVIEPEGQDWLDELMSTAYVQNANQAYKVYIIYKFVKKSRDKKAVLEDKRWDKINMPSSMPACKRLLDVFDGDVKRAVDAVFKIGEHFEKRGVSWNLNTVFRNITDFEEGRLNDR